MSWSKVNDCDHESDTSSQSSEPTTTVGGEPDEPYEEKFITNAQTLTELMFDHKQAFEAESFEAALPALKRLCEKRQKEEQKEEDRPLGDWIKGLLRWDKEQEHKKPFYEGRWRDSTGTFYSGATIEIKPNGWQPEGSRRNSVDYRTYKPQEERSEDQRELVELWSTGEKRHFRVKAGKDQNSLRVEERPYQWTLEAVPKWDKKEHFDVLWRVWGEMNKAGIGKILSVLAVLGSADANNFLHALAVKVPGSLMVSNPAFKNRVATFRRKFSDDVEKVVPPQFRKNANAYSKFPNCILAWLGCDQDAASRTQVVLYFSVVESIQASRTVVESLQASGTCKMGGSGLVGSDFVKFLVQLADLPDEAKLFTTPLGQAAAANCWDIAWPMFAGNRVMDFALIAMLMAFLSPSTYSFHSEQPLLPKQWQILLVVPLLSYGATAALVWFVELRAMVNWSGILDPSQKEATTARKLVRQALVEGSERPTEEGKEFRKSHCLPKLPKLFTLAKVLLEVYSLIWALRLINNYFVRHWKFPESVMIQNSPYMGGTDANDESTKNSCLGLHPVGLGILIFAKWLQLMMASLNVPLLRRTLGTMLPAWYAIKSRESIACLGYMLCLTFGCALPLLGLPYNTHFHDEAGEQRFAEAFLHMFRINFMSDFDMAYFETPGEEVKPCIHIYVCLMALAFSVIFLSLYTGVLYAEYEKLKGNLTQISCEYTVETTLKDVLQRNFWLKRYRYFFGPCSARGRPSRSKAGIWICMPAELVEDPVHRVG